ncbi:nitroreductase family deazaflavin-dependent oxidoreductase [Microlunatus sp. Gsoil 973]|uniref:nitroreductase family deazaflavin-dependent oxidoreductase n=1 Tax=Microlunatus sp. Gsoil 973 TaxID=2672569 RepID=UPI0012B4E7D5|nr:nitroreductase family deazaflavin-dependent oxidoreductase [Microlunatus sp. Gsoil 973]QGN32661.1 nitroreductase family deazaflavin-dependent oxidoreductase [Microlunatus sp. Gsoil 973]
MGVLTPLARRIGAIGWLPGLLPQITAVDRWLQRASQGRLSLLTLAGLPNLMLIVPGRTSGIEHATPLLCVPQRDGWLVAGSAFGGPRTPAWAHNLRAAERAQVTFRGRTYRVTVDELSGDERDRAWDVMSQVWPNYRLYERRTSRVIPVFRLAPADPPFEGDIGLE